jgi:hypothetical protein
VGSYIKCPLFLFVSTSFFQNIKGGKMHVAVLKCFHACSWMDGQRNFSGQGAGMKKHLENYS